MIDEITDIKLEDINKYEKYLKLKPNYTLANLKYNFIKFSKAYHPANSKGNEKVFDKLVWAYEVLFYFLENKKRKVPANKLVEEWNAKGRTIVLEKLFKYKKLTASEYLNEVEVNPIGFKIFKGCFTTTFFVLAILMAVVFIVQIILGTVSIFGIIYLGIAISGIIIRIIRGSGWRILGDYRDYKY